MTFKDHSNQKVTLIPKLKLEIYVTAFYSICQIHCYFFIAFAELVGSPEGAALYIDTELENVIAALPQGDKDMSWISC